MQPHCSGKDLLPNERNGNLNFLGIRLRTRSFILIASFRVNPYAGSDSPMHTWTYNSKNRLNDTKSNRFDVIWNGNDIFRYFSSCSIYKIVIRQILIFWMSIYIYIYKKDYYFIKNDFMKQTHSFSGIDNIYDVLMICLVS